MTTDVLDREVNALIRSCEPLTESQRHQKAMDLVISRDGKFQGRIRGRDLQEIGLEKITGIIPLKTLNEKYFRYRALQDLLKEKGFEWLYNKFLSRIHAQANRYFSKLNDKNDIMQIGSIAFFEATKSYDGTIKFSAFAQTCIDRQLRNMVKTETRQKQIPGNKLQSINQELNYDGFTLEDCLKTDTPDIADVVCSGGMSYRMRRCFDKMTDLEKYSIYHVYIEGRSYQEIAKMLHAKSTKSIDHAIIRAKKKIWLEYSDEFITRQDIKIKH